MVDHRIRDVRDVRHWTRCAVFAVLSLMAGVAVLMLLMVMAVPNRQGLGQGQEEHVETVKVMDNDTTTNITKCDRGIVMPVYRPHFPELVEFIKSVKLHSTDTPPIWVITSTTNETRDLLSQLSQLSPTTDKANPLSVYSPTITVVDLVTMMSTHFGIEVTDASWVTATKFPIQSVKKLYGALYCECQQVLILDAEALVTRATSWAQVFDDYYDTPFIITSRIQYENTAMRIVMEDVMSSLGMSITALPPRLWNLEYQGWFMERSLLLQYVDHVQRVNEGKSVFDVFRRLKYIFEMSSYAMFLYYNPELVPTYRFYNVEDLAAMFLTNNHRVWYQIHYTKEHGVMEKLFKYMNKETLAGLVRMSNFLRLRFFRLDADFPAEAKKLLPEVFSKVDTLTVQVSSSFHLPK